jgi:hypothetical protein
VPSNIEHSLVWTKRPIVHPAVVDPSIAARVAQDGLWGFTGTCPPPPSPDVLARCLAALSDWGVTSETILRSPPPTEAEAALLAAAGAEVDRFMRNNWDERVWETAWIVNPPVRMTAIV